MFIGEEANKQLLVEKLIQKFIRENIARNIDVHLEVYWSSSEPTATNDSNQGSYIRSYPLYIDCLELYNQGFQKDGIYTISLETGPRLVRCDQNNGGWTVIQRREYGEESFYRSGQLYVDGFGEVYGDYWIGLENIRYLTETSSSLVIEMETFGDTSPNEAFARYSNFQLDSGSNQYRLAVSGFEGDCDDGLEYHNGAKFSTYDFDNDIASDRDCADEGQGGWWYVMCYDSNLNGPYSHSSYVNVVNDAGITWASCWGYGYSLKRVEMKVKRN
ncbi:Microfibril-associated glycoprotein 4 [Mactra antiquata]